MPSKKDLLRKLLKGIETGDAMAAAVVDEERYIQHTPQTHEGGEGLASLFARLSKTDPKVTFVRVFEDGNFAFAHNEYDFDGVQIAFEVFRFEGERAVEHWDNIQRIAGPNASGHGMTDGVTAIMDLNMTEANRGLARDFVETVLIGRCFEKSGNYMHESLIQHAPDIADGISAWSASMENYRYDRLHRVLTEGNFALCMCEGAKNGVHSGLYSLFRIEDQQIAEHWSTVEAIPPSDQWKNDNGKF